MFASPFASPFAAGPGRTQFYREVGVRTGVSEASPHQLITMLYDGLVESLVQARGALSQGNMESKSLAISKAVRIVDEGLKAALNTKEGGALAMQLEDLYAYIALRLTEANIHNDGAAVEECLHLIEPLREGWTGIASQVARSSSR